MAKYSRFDPRNKKRNKHKQFVKEGKPNKKIHYVSSEEYKRENVSAYS